MNKRIKINIPRQLISEEGSKTRYWLGLANNQIDQTYQIKQLNFIINKINNQISKIIIPIILTIKYKILQSQKDKRVFIPLFRIQQFKQIFMMKTIIFV